MSLLNPQQQAIQPTREQKLKFAARNIKGFTVQAYKQICEIQQRGIDMLWSHREFTPQELIDELGPDAVKVFQYHGGITSYLIALAQAEGIQPNIKLPTNAFEVENGTITVLEEPYTP
jgi:hypothetical protein